MGKYTSGKKKGQEKAIGWEGVLLPKALIESVFYAAEAAVKYRLRPDIREL